MTNVPGWIISFFVNSVWEIALIGAAGWLVARLLRKLGPQAEHIVWVSTLGLAVVTSALPIFRGLFNVLYAPYASSGNSSITLLTTQIEGLYPGSVYVLPAVIALLLLSLYYISLLYFAVRLAWSLHCTAKLLRQTHPVSLTLQQEEIWRSCKRSFSLDAVRILSSSRIPGPVALGLRTPVLLLPDKFAADCTSQDLFAALAHECAHIKRRDFQKNLFYEVAALIVSFHPVIWMIKSNIAKTREMICDRMATERLIDPRSYTQSLLRLATMVAITSRVSTTHAIGIFDANILEKRIMMMNVRKQHISSALKYGLVIPATLFLLSTAVGGAAMAVEIQSHPTTNQAKPYGQVYRIGDGVSAPVLTHQEDAEFPKAYSKNKDKKVDGDVLLSLVVDTSGMPHDVHVIHSFNPDFNAKAIQAVQQYRFTPAKRAGEPVAVALNIEVHFARY
jgi:TonB family protein